MKTQKGFTLIELMIVVAIIGILAAIAIPAYQDYIARSQVSEAVSLMSGGKTPLAEYYSDKGVWPTAPGSVMGTIAGKYTSTIAYLDPSVAGSSVATMSLEATMKSAGSVNKNIAGKTIELGTTDGGKVWTCAAGSLDSKYVPGACK
ncbi:MAG TPA: pilin [Nevskiaceae bacterium]|nr:pilin [Nevskiaceae bacterium]